MKYYAYVGCDTDAKKEGIHILAVNADTGQFERVGILSGVMETIYFALNRAHTHLYTVQANPDLPRGQNGVIACYTIGDNHLLEAGYAKLGVGAPCHIALDADEKVAAWADYGSAVSGICEILPDGSLSTDTPVTVKHTGELGPNKARQEKPHAHCSLFTPDNKYLCVVDLGLDQVKAYRFAQWKQGLAEVPEMTVKTAPGAGPRHLTFHPSGEWMFLLNELGNTVSSYAYTGGAFKHICTLPTLPDDFTGRSTSAAIKTTADGKIVLTSNRGHDSIAAFAFDAQTGQLRFMAHSMLAGKTPRDFELMPGERFALVGHQDSNEIRSYAFDASSGKLTPVHDPLPAHRPLCFKFGARVP